MHVRLQKLDRDTAASSGHTPYAEHCTILKPATTRIVGRRGSGVATSHAFQKLSLRVQMQETQQRLYCPFGRVCG
ncbi:hypothetical protein IG631_20357 [Alternaria alternata]|nr:hypothetical protein IG631_20357 [Alternaria alternata]